MPSVGFEGAYGQQAMAEQIRQRIKDALEQTKTAHAMSVEDQRLALEKQRYDQEAQDRALLRSQQGAAFNEKIAEGTATNLGAGPTIISPALAERFKNTTLVPLVKPDETLPSTQIASGMAAPGSADTSTAPAVTSQAPTLTGQLRFAGLPALNKQAADDAQLSQIANDPKTPPAIRGFLQIRTALPKGENIPYQLITEPNGPQKAPEPVVRTNAAKGVVERMVNGQWQPVTGDVPAGTHFMPEPTPAQPNPQPQIFKGPDGKDHAIQFIGGKAVEIPLPEGLGKENATMATRLASAKAVTQTGDDMIKELSDPTLAAQLGPVMSRYNSMADFIGAPPPEFAKLAGQIESYSLANMGVHGMRSASGAEAVKATLGQGRHTPATIIAVIQGLNGFANHLMENEGRTSPPPVGPPAPAAIETWVRDPKTKKMVKSSGQ